MDYLQSLLPPPPQGRPRPQPSVVVIPDTSGRSLAQKLLDRPDILADLRRMIAGRPALIEPWNVTNHEVAVARALGVPINGTDPALWPLGFKSAGRRIFRAAGVDLPHGHEDIRTPDDILHAVTAIRQARPTAPGVVVKHDDSVSGDGNAVLRFGKTSIADQVAALPPAYLAALRSGGIVEELISGEGFTSPSAQLDALPDGSLRLIATHEQVLGGPDRQTYLGCRFPADPAYAPALARSALAIGADLVRRGVIGRFSVDFAVARTNGKWRVCALEVNLRKGGTTHPFATLRNLVPGHYDAEQALWHAEAGGTRAYQSTDNLVDPAWTGLPPALCIAALRQAGLQFNPALGTGVVLHMLSCLAIDGRCGQTAIATSPAAAAQLAERAASVIAQTASSWRQSQP